MRNRSEFVYESVVLILTFLSLSCHEHKNQSAPKSDIQTLVVTTNLEGISEANFDPKSKVDQILTIDEATSAAKGVNVAFPPGTLNIDTKIFVEEGISAKETIVQSLALPETPETRSASVIIRPADVSVIPLQPLKITLPISNKISLLSESFLVVLYLGWTKDGLKAGIITSEQLIIEDTRVSFRSPYFGQFQLATISVIPSKLEAASTQKITTSSETKKIQSLYLGGSNKGIAGYWKDNVWTGLAKESDGHSTIYGIEFDENRNIYAFGSININSDNYATGTPGYWLNDSWTELSKPNTIDECSLVSGKIIKNKVHAVSQCLVAGIRRPVYWIGQSSTVLPSSSVNIDSIENAGISSDLQGNVFIAATQYLTDNMIVGEWFNGVWSPINAPNDGLWNSLFISGPRTINKSGQTVYTFSAYSTTALAFRYPMVIDGRWTDLGYYIGAAYKSSDGDLYFPARNGEKSGYSKDGKFIELDRPSDIEPGTYFGPGTLAVSRDGTVYLAGSGIGTLGVLSGFWKNNQWQTVSNGYTTDKTAINSVTVF